MPDIISEFRQRYPQYQDIPDSQVYMKLADPKMFKQVFPEYQDLDDHTIGKNLAAEAGQVKDTGKGVLETAGGDVKSMLGQMWDTVKPKAQPKGTLQDFANEQDAQDKAHTAELTQNADARKKAGYSLPYRAAANTLEGLGLFSSAPMERAAAQGHSSEVIGHAIPPVAAAVAPLAVEGVVGAGRAVRDFAMEDPAIARQKAMNVTPKSKQAIRAQKEGTAAAPYLKGVKNLADVQARIPAAKQEIFQPYMDAVAKHDATGQMLKAPDGSPVTASQLEDLRQETSAQLKDLRKMQPTDQQAILQKNQSMTALNDKYRAITSELDPAIKNQGIDPKRTRAAFGAVKGVEKRFEGRSTLLEGQPSGLGKLGKVDITKPLEDLGKLGSATRDIAADRPWFRQKPTDVQVREGFRKAGPKPDLTAPIPPTAQGPQVRGLLPAAPLVTPPPGASPITTPPPAVAATSRAQRLGLLLPEQSVSSARPQLPTGYVEPAAPGAVHYEEAPAAAVPAVPTEPGTAVPANIRIVRDPATGRMKRQYLTSAGGQIIREEPVTVKEAVTANPAEMNKNGAKLTPRASMEIPAELKTKLDQAGLVNKGEVMPGSGVYQVEHPDAPGKTFAVQLSDSPEVMKQKAAAKIAEFKPKETSQTERPDSERIAQLRAVVRDSPNAIERRSAAAILDKIYSVGTTKIPNNMYPNPNELDAGLGTLDRFTPKEIKGVSDIKKLSADEEYFKRFEQIKKKLGITGSVKGREMAEIKRYMANEDRAKSMGVK